MTHYVEKTKTAALLAAFTAVSVFATGCSKEAPATEEFDLTQSTNLFEQPLQPNPLALQSEDVVVTVNGQNITHGEVMQGVQMNMMQLSRQVPAQQLSQMAGQIYQNVQDTLIANILLTEAAGKSSLTVDDAAVDAEIEKIKSGAPEDSSLEDALAENNIEFSEWKNNLREQMLVRKLVDEKTADVPEATATEVAEFYQQNLDSFKAPESVTASHILVAFKPEDTDETKAAKKKEIEAIREQLVAGGDFETIAKEKSDCPSGQRGGSLGSFTRGQMVPEFENVAFSANVGDLSDVVETQFGYHLIKVTDHKQDSTRPLSEVKDQLQSYLTGQHKQKALLAYIDELKAKAAIEYKKPDLDAAATAPAAEAPTEPAE
ncbi:MAG: peptidylprolyl isomerase [Kiritimatiellales bacterium]